MQAMRTEVRKQNLSSEATENVLSLRHDITIPLPIHAARAYVGLRRRAPRQLKRLKRTKLAEPVRDVNLYKEIVRRP